MILEAGEKDLLPVAIRLFDGNEPRALQYIPGDSGRPTVYECLRFRCRVITEQGAAEELQSSQNDDEAQGTCLFETETEKKECGINGGTPADTMRFFMPLQSLGAVPGQYPFEVQLVTYAESAPNSAKTEDDEMGVITVLFGDGDNCLKIHKGVDTWDY